METKQTPLKEEFPKTETTLFLDQFISPFAIAAISLVIASYFITSPLNFNVSVLSILKLFGCGFFMAYLYANTRNPDRCIITFVWKMILFLTSIVSLMACGISIWQLTLIWVV